MVLHTYIPYSNDPTNITNLGKAYNSFMELVDDDCWVCFLDHDATFTVGDWHPHIVKTIQNNPEYGLLTCMTNRIGNFDQKFDTVDENNHDIAYHRMTGLKAREQFDTRVDEALHLISGVILVLNKKTWKATGGFENGFLGVDNCIHDACKANDIKVGIMRGTYVYHWYRGDGNEAHVQLANQQNKNPWPKNYKASTQPQT